MTATERLRAMLDERGVEYGGGDTVVYFEDGRGYKVSAYDAPRRYGDCILCVCHTATPQQAIAATLGAGTCRMIYDEEASGDELWPTEEYYCSECGKHVYTGKPNFCPNCGRRCVD